MARRRTVPRLSRNFIARCQLFLCMVVILQTYCACNAFPTIRLRGGRHPAEGNVEVFRDGHWGSVCDDEWSLEDGAVACRQLGHKRVTAVFGHSAFGRVPGRSSASRVACSGHEQTLQDCSATWNGASRRCNKNRLAGVQCLPKKAKRQARGGELAGVSLKLQPGNLLKIVQSNRAPVQMSCKVDPSVWEAQHRTRFTVFDVSFELNNRRLQSTLWLTVQRWPMPVSHDPVCENIQNCAPSAAVRWRSSLNATSGSYTCVVHTPFGILRNTIQLQFLAPFKGKPKFYPSVPETSLTVRRGEPFTLPCQGYGGERLSATLHYLKLNKWYMVITNTSSATTKFASNGYLSVDNSYAIESVQPEHSLHYMCELQNEFGTVERHYQLQVEVPAT